MLQNHISTIVRTMEAQSLPWYMNLIDLRTQKSYFICQDHGIQKWLSDLLDVPFKGSIAAADHMWLRKKIGKRDLAQKEGKHENYKI